MTAVRSAWNEPRTAIHTYSDVRIDRVILGEAPPVVTVRTPGGEADGVRVEVAGFPELRRAQRVVLFLQLGNDGTARVTGHRQGQYTIVRGPRGETMAISSHRPDPHVVGPTEPDPRLPAVLPLAELEARVLSLARSARTDRDRPFVEEETTMRSRTLRLFVAGVAAAAFVATAGTVSGWNLLSPQRTWDGAPTYLVDDRGLSSVADGDGGISRTVNAVKAWNSAGRTFFITAQAGSMSGFSQVDGMPMLNFQDPFGDCTGSCLAATYITSYSQRSNGGGYTHMQTGTGGSANYWICDAGSTTWYDNTTCSNVITVSFTF